MGNPGPHAAIIRAAAKAHLGPLGFRQKGRSRTWYRDHGWWLAIVEFQPSSWSKGSYLNVACMWLWHPQDHFAFHVCERLGRYAEFLDEASFGPAAEGLARMAAEGALKNEQQFRDVHSALAYLEEQVVGSQSHWDHYNAMMAALACSQIDRAAKYSQSLLRLKADYEWCLELQSLSRHIMEAARTDAITAVEEQVTLARQRLALPAVQSLRWAAGEA
ncbi:DUF4304 domain-containing protein [Piscinibacter sp.]|uniref:DUF4304 domain-containing protein n=1 Tax=Piscinibacter sp. TaxID=1903157 RepID=UPI0039E5E741